MPVERITLIKKVLRVVMSTTPPDTKLFLWTKSNLVIYPRETNGNTLNNKYANDIETKGACIAPTAVHFHLN